MPEFIMEGAAEAARELDEFTLGYVEALLFTNCSPAWTSSQIEDDPKRWGEALEAGTADGELPCDAGYNDFSPEALDVIKSICADFQKGAGDLIALACGDEYTPQRAGNDLWFTSNGHGVGYWDRAEIAEQVRDALTAAARIVGNLDPYWNTETSKIELY